MARRNTGRQEIKKETEVKKKEMKKVGKQIKKKNDSITVIRSTTEKTDALT